MIQIVPYQAVGDIRFGISEAELLALDRPRTIKRDRFGEIICTYADKQVTLSDDGVVEVGFGANVQVEVDREDIFKDPGAFRKLCDRDGSPFEHLGFIILLELGVTLTGFHDNLPEQRAVTAFAKGRWDDIRTEMTPYHPR